MRNLLLVLGGLAVAVVVVVGLVAVLVMSGGGGEEASQGTPTAQATGTPSVQSTGTPSATAGGELRLLGRDPLTFDPACASDVDSANYIVELFSGLVTIDRDLKIVPDIAESWETSPDGTVYTFHLRRGVLFQDRKSVV